MTEPRIAAKSRAVYHALDVAAERMGTNNYGAQLAAWIKRGRKASTFRFYVTPEQRAVCDALGSWTITDNEAMSLLHEPEVLRQRLGTR